MLSELHIENLGLIEDLTLRFGPGLTAVTGETGAGKTMLIEAISLLLGERAEATLVRPGSEEARVEGRFVIAEAETILARTIPVDGRSRAYINGRLATAAALAEFGEGLVDMHGQNSHQSLLSVGSQRAALDLFGGIDLGELVSVRRRRSLLEAELAGLGGDERMRAREADLLQFQLDELDRADLTDPDEEAKLEVEERTLSSAVADREAAERALAALADDGGVLDQLRAGLASLVGKLPFHDMERRLRSAAAELDDVVSDLRTTADRIEEDPDRLAQVRARRQHLRDLCRKYGDGISAVIAEQQRLQSALDQLLRHGDRVADLAARIASESDREMAASVKVAALRRKMAAPLGTAVQRHLRELALPRARLVVEASGEGPADDVTFQFQANPGETLLPLAKIASGGELARTMLALRLVLSDAPSTLIFDEVDAGIGGEAALAVGRSLAQLGRGHQVFVVTHLAQVAAFADQHIVVHKAVVGNRTRASASTVVDDIRTRELARMLSGMTDSSSAHRHAEELLHAARSSASTSA